TALLTAKIIYNTLLLLLIGLLTWAGLSLFVGNAVVNTRPFLLAVGLGSLGFAVTFTFISAISAKTDNGASLMAILSFPLIIPILVTLVNLSKNAIEPLASEGVQSDINMLVAIDLMVVGMSLLLYPYLWRD
nr:heme exporter protein CcmB [Saprospiraceae bacterium]